MKAITKTSGFGTLGLILALLLLIPLIGEGADLKVKITVARANIRQSGAMDSAVIASGENGQIYDVIRKTGEWYELRLAGGGRGFIHQSVVQEIAEGTPAPKRDPVPATVTATPRTAQPAASPARTPAPVYRSSGDLLDKKFYVRIGGGMASKKTSYNNFWEFDLYYETGNIQENYDIDASGFIVDAGIGYYLLRNIGLELSYVPASGKTNGSFGAYFPHPFYFGYYRETLWADDNLKFSSPELNLNVVARFPVLPRVHAYLTAGGTYFMGVKIETLKSFGYGETEYPYLDMSVTPQFATYTKSGFGFNGGAGLDVFLVKSAAVNLNVRYSSGEVTIPVESAEYKIKTGGLRASGGLKIVF